MTTPLLPVTAEETVAVNLSPASAEVHARPSVVIPTRVPTPMMPRPGAGAGSVDGAGLGSRPTGAGSDDVGRGVRVTGAGGVSRLGVGLGVRVRVAAGDAAGDSLAFVEPPTGASLNTVCGGA